MRLLITLTLTLLCVASSSAQTFDFDLVATANKKLKTIQNQTVYNQGDTLRLLRMDVKKSEAGFPPHFLLVTDRDEIIDMSATEINQKLMFHASSLTELWDAKVAFSSIPLREKYGPQYDLRHELELDALQFVQIIRDKNLELNDPYLKNYLYGLVTKIISSDLIDNRTTNINLIIQKDPTLNAYCYPNGTIVINTGLIAALHSESEMVAVLSHEIAHYALDHHVANVNAAITRQKRAEFWGAFAVGVAAVADGVLASQNDSYAFGTLTASTAVLASVIAAGVVERLGMKYNHEQEVEADEIAIQVLRLLNYDTNALSTALNRMEKVYAEEQNTSMYLNSYTHPALVERVQKLGTPSMFIEQKYEQIASNAVSVTARYKFEIGRIKQSLPYLDQNIRNGVATVEDYLLKAQCLLSTGKSSETILSILNLLTRARALNGTNLAIDKMEILTYLRLENYDTAISLLGAYKQNLMEMSIEQQTTNYRGCLGLDNVYLAEELLWANNMICKITEIAKN